MGNVDDKNKSDENEWDRLAEDDNYRFIKETIKEKPFNKKLFLTKLAGALAAGVLFGAAAAVAFTMTKQAMAERIEEKEPAPKINIPMDETPGESTPTPQVTEVVTETPQPQPEIVEVERELGIQDYEKIYQDVLKIAEEPRKAIVTVSSLTGEETLLDNSYLQGGQSVGVIIVENDRDFYILTESQATDNAKEIQVTLKDGTIASGRLQRSDARTGLAVVLVEKAQLSEETLSAVSVASLGNSYSLIQGKPVIAIGNPSGYHDSVSYGTITSVINRIAVTDAEYNLLTTDILGSSKGSGVLLDLEGEVIGIIAQSFGSQDEETKNMIRGLAVSQLKPLIEMLSNGEEIRYLGVKGQDVTEAISKSTGIPVGVYVDEVEEDSPAMKSGIQSGDVIVKMDDQEVTTVQKYSTLLQKYTNGQRLSLQVMRSKGVEGYSPVEVQLIVRVK